MKVRAAVRRLCEYCKVVKRRNRVFILCSVNPKHKQRQGFCDFAYDSPLPPMPLESSSEEPKTARSSEVPKTSGAGEGVGLASLLSKD